MTVSKWFNFRVNVDQVRFHGHYRYVCARIFIEGRLACLATDINAILCLHLTFLLTPEQVSVTFRQLPNLPVFCGGRGGGVWAKYGHARIKFTDGPWVNTRWKPISDEATLRINNTLWASYEQLCCPMLRWMQNFCTHRTHRTHGQGDECKISSCNWCFSSKDVFVSVDWSYTQCNVTQNANTLKCQHKILLLSQGLLQHLILIRMEKICMQSPAVNQPIFRLC